MDRLEGFTEQDKFIREMIIPGVELSGDEIDDHDPQPTIEEEIAFEKGMDAIRESERQAWAESKDIIL